MSVSNVELLKGRMVLTGGTGPNSNPKEHGKMRLVLDAAGTGSSTTDFGSMLVAEGSSGGRGFAFETVGPGADRANRGRGSGERRM
jgi:hypothetical protein